MKRLILIFFLIITIANCINAQDIITKTDNTEIKAKILEISSIELRYKKFDHLEGPTIVLLIKEIKSIKYTNGSIENYNNSTATSIKKETTETKEIIPNKVQGGFTNKVEAKNETINGLKQGKWLEYLKMSSNYQLISTFEDSATYYRLVNYKDDNFEGIERFYEVNGKLLSEVEFVNGKANIKIYYDNGILRNETPLTNGQANGVVRTFHENGQLSSEKIFTNGLANGISKTYYKNGKISFENTLLNNKLNGTSKFFNEQGQLASETFFENNVGTGTTKFYDENGNMYSMQYKDEKGNSVNKTFNKKNGNIQSLTVMNDNFKVLESKVYYDSGQLMSESFFDDSGNIIKTKNYKEKRKDLTEDEKKEYDANRRKERLEFWNDFTQGVIMITQQTLAYQDYRNNPNSQTLANYSKVIINNSTKDGSDAIKENNTIINNSANSITVESSATTNGGSSSNPQQAAICAKQSAKEWENSTAYMNYMNNQSCNKMAYISQREQAEILLKNCKQYCSPADIEVLNKTISTLTSQINSMPDCQIINFEPGKQQKTNITIVPSNVPNTKGNSGNGAVKAQ